jgi:mRNA interferase MazF
MENSGFLADFFLLFDKWNAKKKKRSVSKKIIGIKERDIVFIQMGKNIGYEQDGKGEEFLRPVVIYKKYNRNMFLGIPLTTQLKDNRYYFTFTYKNRGEKEIENAALLSQIRVYDTKRVKYKSGVIAKDDFVLLHKKLLEVNRPDVSNFPIEGKSPEGIQ